MSDCMRSTQLLARAETALLYSRLFLVRVEEGKSKASPSDIHAGISTASGLLDLKSSYLPSVVRTEKMVAIGRSLKPIAKELLKMKSISKGEAGKLKVRVDRLVNKVEALWPLLERECDLEKKSRRA